jgi:hypothetical protein
VIHEALRTARTLIRTCGVVTAIYICRGFLSAIAGKETILALKLSFLADIRFAIAVSLAVAASGWALAERWLRHRKVESMQGRIRDLELKIDPNRTTTGLTPKGKTNPRDKWP